MNKFSQANFDAEVLKSDKPVLVKFYADWCMPCRLMAPMVNKVAAEYEGKVVFGEIDTEADMGLTQSQGIMSLPTMKLFVNGVELKKMVGLVNEAVLKTVLEDALF